ncbi:MAG: CopG family transcriptional regulator [Symploca sp. SIO2G7]|nr:CopG family transcriptional regulator [Symploca sp. SIO2G7]
MQSQKLSIFLPSSLVKFIEGYRVTKGCQSSSQVIEVALELLREQELEKAYIKASQEIDTAWDVTIADGLVDETW